MSSKVLPARWMLPPLVGSGLFVVLLAGLAWALSQHGFPLVDLFRHSDNALIVLDEMTPPDTSRLWATLGHACVSLEMAVIGVAAGLLLSLPLSLLIASNCTPHPIIATFVRQVVTFMRSVPEIIWALFFIPWVGLGAPAGILAIMVDTIGFNGRFYAEDMEQAPRGPAEALRAAGAGKISQIFCTIVPASLPGMTRNSLYALERGVRSSTILGVVGAGGIGAEVQVSMEMMRFAQASTVILVIFFLVAGVELTSTWIRRKLLKESK